MSNIRLKILDKGHIVQEQLIRVLQKHEDALASNTSGDSAISDRVTALETAVGSSTGESASGIAKDVSDVVTAIGDESTEGTILARIKALEDAQPSQQGDG